MKTFKTFISEVSKLMPDIKDLHKHVTITEPSGSNVTKMHDMVNDIAKAYDTPRDDIYNTITNNPKAHQKYKDAASLTEDKEFPLHYKHCAISKNSKSVNKRNPISGHDWSEDEPMPGFSVSGGKLGQRNYTSLDKAKAAVDFDHKFNT
jgi:hypothetical protein